MNSFGMASDFLDQPHQSKSPIEKRYTYEYAQPSNYAFCQDSVLAPIAIANDLIASSRDLLDRESDLLVTDSDFSNFRVLDVCAGCGVMGFELHHALPELRKIDFLEIQNAFEPAFRQNVELVTKNGKRNGGDGELRTVSEINSRLNLPQFNWLQKPYSVLQLKPYAGAYDLVICNPPYFDLGEGTLPADAVKQRARFFIDDTLESLLLSLRSSLKPKGRAYLLMKSGKKHGRDAFTLAQSLLSDCEITKVADIRGTDLVRLLR